MIGRETTAGTTEGLRVGAEGDAPLPQGVRGYKPPENVDIFNTSMCILECRIGIVYGEDNMAVVGFLFETSGDSI